MSFLRTLITIFFLSLILIVASLEATAQFIGFEILSSRGRTTFSFEKVNNLVIVPVMLNDRLPLNFILDTGVRTTILTDREISDIVNISYDRALTISGAGQIRQLNAYLASNVSLSLPGIQGKGQSLIVLEEDYLELRNHLGMNVHGIIGYEFFNHFVVQIDYENKLITVFDPEVFKPRKRFTALPFEVEQGRPYIRTQIKQKNGTIIHPKLLIDSGASHGLLLEADTDENIYLPADTLRTIIGWGLGGEMKGHLGRVNRVNIDRYELKDVLVSFATDYSDPEISRRTGRQGTIGGDLLNRFTVIFDYPGEMLYLQRNRTFSQPFEFNLGGIDIIATGAGYNSFKIINVIGNSPAYHAGVKAGDIILAVNGKFSQDLTLTEVNNLLRSRPGNRLSLMLSRDNSVIRVTFRLKRMV